MERGTWKGSLPHSITTIIARLPKLLVDVLVKRLVDCVEDSDEMKSREHLQGYIDILNTELCDEAV